MNEFNDNKSVELETILARLESIEKRLSIVEYDLCLDAETIEAKKKKAEKKAAAAEHEENSMESKIGGYGLALLGNIVFLVGIIFLSQYIHNQGFIIFSGIFGVVAVGGIFLLSHYFRKKIVHMSSLFKIAGHLLLYYVVLRFHFYIDKPIIENATVSIVLLLAVVGFQIFYAFRNKSQLYGGIAIFLALMTAMISGYTHLMLSVACLVAAGSVVMLFFYDWQKTLVLSIFLVYFTFIYWLLTNVGVKFDLGIEFFHHYSHFYLMAVVGIYSMIVLIKEKEGFTSGFVFTSIALNGFFFSFVVLLFVLSFFIKSYTLMFVIISSYCMIYSVILKYYSGWKFAPALYALYGFVAISVSVYGIFGFPYVFLCLSLQSLLVVSVALWYRSKIIISMNVVLFLGLLISYLVISDSVDIINISFAVVSIAIARIMNWQKQRLDIKTEVIRNIYLVVAFGMVLYSLKCALPESYVTLSWAVAGMAFFMFSLVLHNVKYRWMAIGYMLAAAGYLFLVDLSRIALVYRIIALMCLAVISIGISLYYSRKKMGNKPEAVDTGINENNSLPEENNPEV